VRDMWGGEGVGLLTLLRYMILLAEGSPSQHARPSPFCAIGGIGGIGGIDGIAGWGKRPRIVVSWGGWRRRLSKVMEARCYVMSGLFGDKLLLT
jgi:hypothetical protein